MSERPIPEEDDLVETMARALNLEAGRQRGLAFDDDWYTLTEQERGGWRLCARAALAAVRDDIERAAREDALSALDAIVLHHDMPDGESWEEAYNEVVEIARSAAARLREGGRDAS